VIVGSTRRTQRTPRVAGHSRRGHLRILAGRPAAGSKGFATGYVGYQVRANQNVSLKASCINRGWFN
jgi:hypothetical protein